MPRRRRVFVEREISRERYLITALGIERWGMTAKPLEGLLGRLPEAVSRWESRLGCHTSHCLIVALVAREKATMR
jgi:hypothetical protein